MAERVSAIEHAPPERDSRIPKKPLRNRRHEDCLPDQPILFGITAAEDILRWHVPCLYHVHTIRLDRLFLKFK
jgi:hypothetical protein